jgi:hypothetical protein
MHCRSALLLVISAETRLTLIARRDKESDLGVFHIAVENDTTSAMGNAVVTAVQDVVTAAEDVVMFVAPKVASTCALLSTLMVAEGRPVVVVERRPVVD